MSDDLISRATALAAVTLGNTVTQLHAAIRAIPTTEVCVKPLEWLVDEYDPDCLVAGDYTIWFEFGGYQLYFWSIVQGELHPTFDDAARAAWEHHEPRILAQLETLTMKGS